MTKAMTEVDLLRMINLKRNELEEKQSAKAETKVLTKLEKEIDYLTERLINYNAPGEKQVFEDNCRG